MNKSLLTILCSVLFTMVGITSLAQQKVDLDNLPKHRCGTDEMIERRLQTDPAFKTWYEQAKLQANQAVAQYKADVAAGRTNGTERTTTLTSVVTIPIVFHIVMPDPWKIRDADVDTFVAVTNRSFSGFNFDSTNAGPFMSIRGHSLIQFTLAKRDPSGNPTTGIERRISNTNFSIANSTNIKRFAQGGLDIWDRNRYYNVWVGLSPDLYGVAADIGLGSVTDDGVCVSDFGFAKNPCYTDALANQGKTGAHEIGHNFGLYHVFNSGCGDTDNNQVTSTISQFPASILALPDQSPAQAANTGGSCPTGTVATGCGTSPNPPGKNYQNYMDYTNDPCLTMFSNTQVARMEYNVEFFRPGYLTTTGGQLPASVPTIDVAARDIISPGGAEYLTNTSCAAVTYNFTCPGNFTPRLRISNYGSTTLNNVTVVVTIGATTFPAETINLATPLAYGRTTIIALSAKPLSVGNNTITYNVTQGNGTADAVSGNSSVTINYVIAAPTPLPRAANFVGITPDVVAAAPGFTNVTVAGTSTAISWIGEAVGNGGSNGSIGINFFSMGSGNVRDFRSTPASFTPLPNVADSIIVTFDVNYRTYTTEADRLQLLYSLDCGVTWLPTGFDKAGSVLATLPASTTNYTTPTTVNWRGERVAVKNATIAAGGVIQFAFRGTSAFGNWLYLDNINIAIPVNRDAQVTAITRPNAAECSGSFVPSADVKNNGIETIVSYRVGYSINGGAAQTTPAIITPIAPGATVAVPLPAAAGVPVGANSIRAYVYAITTTGGIGDQNTTNDSLTKPFTVRQIFNAPLVEGFESLPFPSANWAINNPTGTFTWVRVTNAGGFGLTNNSMFVDNYNNTVVGEIDDLVAPPINTTGADSIVVTFDLAHKNFAGFDDILAVGVSNNCGATYAATGYQKQGAVLATAGASTANYTAPIAGDWRKERVAIGGAALSTGSAIILFRRVNGYGNNIFIDNINISLIYRRDIAAQAVARPNQVECSGNFTPAITVRNAGLDTIKSFTGNYSINGGAPVTANFTGLSIAPNGGTGIYNFPAASGLPVGTHTIAMYTTNLVTHLGAGDQNASNDTIRRTFSILGTQAAPLAQNFEGSFAPTNWGVSNPDAGVTWTKATVGFNSNGSATVQNYNYTQANGSTRNDDLITPNITYSNVDSVFLSFDLAALTKQYPGATTIPLDSLQILISKDCGATFTSVFNKWGEDLQTINDPNYPNTLSFNPGVDNAVWKNVKLNITAAAGTSSTGLTVFFRNKSNNDNNIYIDNVNLNTVTLPARLKQQGYLVYPTQNNGMFTVQHFLPPTDLRYVEVFDARGRLVYRKQYGNMGANSTETFNLTREAAGVYQVKLGYTNKVIAERIVKMN